MMAVCDTKKLLRVATMVVWNYTQFQTMRSVFDESTITL